ncbi:PspA/IM30 family protein [Candidatus Viridilinea mediisalina]|uniref:Phage shock protein A n=1 Tax=Candidatus Viridilinea mediisalina TaxID=2024553 RepID=A0A2A6RF66_9CHLR|nr:PspA/IM30 family protein [Candidatus Viridilinea mediisalina]PDW01662.1 phage shock protein A [Candidatus Viridilinea mediisalina]
MSILGRIKDLISANVNSMLDRAEDPEKMANEYLRQLTNEVYEVRTGVATAMADEMRLEQRRVAAFGEVDQWQSKAEAALRAGDEELARAALARRAQAQRLAEQYEQQEKAQEEQVDAMQDALVQLETRIAEVKAKKELIIAKKNRAQTQEALQRTAQRMGQVSAIDKLAQLEERVDDQLNKAEAMARLEQGSLENRFANLQQQTEVDSDLAELKRKLGME